jgi:hypothetical protein
VKTQPDANSAWQLTRNRYDVAWLMRFDSALPDPCSKWFAGRSKMIARLDVPAIVICICRAVHLLYTMRQTDGLERNTVDLPIHETIFSCSGRAPSTLQSEKVLWQLTLSRVRSDVKWGHHVWLICVKSCGEGHLGACLIHKQKWQLADGHSEICTNRDNIITRRQTPDVVVE